MNEQKELKLCKECKHFKDIGSWWKESNGCWVEKKISPIDGEKLYRKCEYMRSSDGPCGEDGKLWEDATTVKEEVVG